jgi:dolichol-phosphate mannosyltransferase
MCHWCLWARGTQGGIACSQYQIRPAIDHLPMGESALNNMVMRESLPGSLVPGAAWSSAPVAAAVANGGAFLSVVVPTFNERDNVHELVRRLGECLRDIAWEVIFVDDDSPDGTVEAVRQLAASDARVRCIHRIGRRGLSSACIEGVMASSAPYVAVMDGDLQHDEAILPRMLTALAGGGLDIAVGSRYVAGGGIGQWDKGRALISRFATRLSQLVVPAELKDPMSGFFMMRRDSFMDCVRQLSALGFKILLDLFASSREPLRFVEIPYAFRNRQAGASKLDNQAAWDYVMLLMDKMVGHLVPVRFLAFAIIGGLGVGVHMTVLLLLFKGEVLGFTTAQAAATITAMVFNFALNNAMTYRDRRLTGLGWVRGLVSFMLACSVGALANVGIADYLFGRSSGWLLAALAGILVGAVWNYAATSFYTWGNKRPR